MNLLRTRVALAGGVALVCAVLSLVLTQTLGSAPPPQAPAPAGPDASASAPKAAPAPKIPKARDPHFLADVGRKVAAGQKSDGAAVPGVSERDLHTFETVTLGSEHADEHAAVRKAERDHPKEMAEEYAAAKRPLAASAATEAAPSAVGAWDESPSGKGYSLPINAIHGTVLPTGKILYFSYNTFDSGGQAARNVGMAFVWDPITHTSKLVPPPLETNPSSDNYGKPANLWCAGQTQLADGRVVVFGGNLELPKNDAGGNAINTWKGLNEVYTFNPFSETWKRQPNMAHGRWYPTGVRLPDGRVPIISGLDESGNLNNNALNADLDMFTPSADINGVGTVQKVGQFPTSGPFKVPNYYPHLFSMASGDVLLSGPYSEDSFSMRFSGGKLTGLTDRPAFAQGSRLWGSAVPIAPNANGVTGVMQIGGRDYPEIVGSIKGSPRTETYSEGSGNWTEGTPLNIGRAHANTVLLPDGSMVEVGGGQGSTADGDQYYSLPEQRQVELYNPLYRTWTVGPAQEEPRAYHSTALLLPDGRVVSAGDDRAAKAPAPGASAQDTAEIYSPPYLFKGGTRPVITSAPAAAELGSSFAVGSSAGITRAVLVAPGAVTHAVDMNQRYLPVSVTQRPGGVTVTAPPNANAAPPGYYMLFLLDSRGVPSVAKFVRLVPQGTLPRSTPVPVPTPPKPKTVGKALSVASKLYKKGSRIKVSRKGTFSIKCRANGTAKRTCKVSVRQLLKHKKTRAIGSGKATIKAKKREAKIRVKLTRTGRKLLKKASRKKGMKVRIDLKVSESGTKRTGTKRAYYRLIR